MTKGLNIYKLSRVRDETSFNIMKKHDSRSEDKRTTQYHEMESFRFFVNALMVSSMVTAYPEYERKSICLGSRKSFASI